MENMYEEIERKPNRRIDLEIYFKSLQENHGFRDELAKALIYLNDICFKEKLNFAFANFIEKDKCIKDYEKFHKSNEINEQEFKKVKDLFADIISDFIQLYYDEFVYQYEELLKEYDEVKKIYNNTNNEIIKSDFKDLLKYIRNTEDIFGYYYRKLKPLMSD